MLAEITITMSLVAFFALCRFVNTKLAAWVDSW